MKVTGMNAGLEYAKKKPNWIVEGLIEAGNQWIIAGPAKCGKSRLAAELAINASEGKPFFGYRCPRKMRVLYIDFELGERLFFERVLAMYGYDEKLMAQNQTFFHAGEYETIDVLQVSDERSEVADVKRTIREMELDLIIWDVLSSTHASDENDNVKMKKVMKGIKYVSQGVAHVVVHHTKKAFGKANAGADGMRGASSIHGEVNGVMSLSDKAGKRGVQTIKFSARGFKGPDTLRLVDNGVGYQLASLEEDAADPLSIKGAPKEGQSQKVVKVFGEEVVLSAAKLMQAIIATYKIGERQARRYIGEAISNESIAVRIIGGQQNYERMVF